MKVLITGGAGYIGSTVASACIYSGIVLVLLNNLSNGLREFGYGRDFYEGDNADGLLIDEIFAEHPDVSAVVHCAALISVRDSISDPTRYYCENVAKTLYLLTHLARNHCTRGVSSLSASLYHTTLDGSVDESSPVRPESLYARTKLLVEQILGDVAVARPMRAVSLRCFNPIRADPRMRTGLQRVQPTRALGKIVVAHLNGETFSITAVSWPTRDGSGLREYVHVWDLARGHVAVLQTFDDIVPRAADTTSQISGAGRTSQYGSWSAHSSQWWARLCRCGSGPVKESWWGVTRLSTKRGNCWDGSRNSPWTAFRRPWNGGGCGRTCWPDRARSRSTSKIRRLTGDWGQTRTAVKAWHG